MTTEPEVAAFFDVDETLVTGKTIFSFLEFHHHGRGLSQHEYDHACRMLADIVVHGGSRAESNRAYYRLFAGQCVADVMESGRKWFAQAHNPAFFHEPVRRRLEWHRERGHLTVLVSGSFHACLDPIADHLGADVVCGSEPEVLNGRCTGDVTAVRIGAGKGAAVREVCAERGIAPSDCYAYGDHASDLDLLRAVGHPVVVGSDPVLLEQLRPDPSHRIEGIEQR